MEKNIIVEQIILVDPSTLRPHPRNTEFFDDISDAKWEDFKADIQRGIKHPLIIDQDNVIISGCQRWRAACELGMTEVKAIRYEYPNEDSRLLDLIALNVRQRFSGQTNDIKAARCARELERLCGNKWGRPTLEEKVERRSTFSGFEDRERMSQDEIAALLKMSPRVLRYLMKLFTLTPELQEAVEQGKISTTVASRVLTQLNQDEQKELIGAVGMDVLGQFTEAELREIVPQIKDYQEQISALRAELKDDYRDVYSESELDEVIKKKEQLEQDKRLLYEKIQSDKKRYAEELKELKAQHAKEQKRTVRLQKILADLERVKETTKEISKLDEEDLMWIKDPLTELGSALDALVAKIGA